MDQEKSNELNKILSIEYDEANNDTPSDVLISRFPFFGISSAFKKFQTHEALLPYEEAAMINFVNKYTTCTLNPASIAEMTENPKLKGKSKEVAEIRKCANIHRHSRTCRKYETICRFNFAKFPIWKTLISKPLNLPSTEKEKKMKEFKNILSRVKTIIDDQEKIDNVLNEYPDRSQETREEFVKNREIRIKKCRKAG